MKPTLELHVSISDRSPIFQQVPLDPVNDSGREFARLRGPTKAHTALAMPSRRSLWVPALIIMHALACSIALAQPSPMIHVCYDWPYYRLTGNAPTVAQNSAMLKKVAVGYERIKEFTFTPENGPLQEIQRKLKPRDLVFLMVSPGATPDHAAWVNENGMLEQYLQPTGWGAQKMPNYPLGDVINDKERPDGTGLFIVSVIGQRDHRIMPVDSNARAKDPRATPDPHVTPTFRFATSSVEIWRDLRNLPEPGTYNDSAGESAKLVLSPWSATEYTGTGNVHLYSIHGTFARSKHKFLGRALSRFSNGTDSAANPIVDLSDLTYSRQLDGNWQAWDDVIELTMLDPHGTEQRWHLVRWNDDIDPNAGSPSLPKNIIIDTPPPQLIPAKPGQRIEVPILYHLTGLENEANDSPVVLESGKLTSPGGKVLSHDNNRRTYPGEKWKAKGGFYLHAYKSGDHILKFKLSVPDAKAGDFKPVEGEVTIRISTPGNATSTQSVISGSSTVGVDIYGRLSANRGSVETSTSLTPSLGAAWTCKGPVPKANALKFQPSGNSITVSRIGLDGKNYTNSVNWTEPPLTLHEGQEITLTINCSASANSRQDQANVIGYWTSDGFVCTQNPPPKAATSQTDNADSARSQTMKLKFVPGDHPFIAFGGGNLDLGWAHLTWPYEKQIGSASPTPSPTPGSEEDKEDSFEDEPQKQHGDLAAHLEPMSVELRPGDISENVNVVIDSWDSDTAEPVKITGLGSGGLEPLANGVLAVPGDYSEQPANMFTSGVTDKTSHVISEKLSVNRGVRAGLRVIHVIVSQGDQQVDLPLNVNVLTSDGRDVAAVGTPTTPGSVGSGPSQASSGALGASIAPAIVQLIRGEPSKTVNLIIEKWNGNTAEPVKVIWVQQTNAGGSLIGGARVHGGTTTLNPTEMHATGTSDQRAYTLPMLMSAEPDATIGPRTYDIILSQGTDTIKLTLMVVVSNIATNSGSPPISQGPIPGSSGSRNASQPGRASTPESPGSPSVTFSKPVSGSWSATPAVSGPTRVAPAPSETPTVTPTGTPASTPSKTPGTTPTPSVGSVPRGSEMTPNGTGTSNGSESLKACGYILGSAIYNKWIQMGGESGVLGCPETNERGAASSPKGTSGRYVQFTKDGGGLLVMHESGKYAGSAFAVRGCMYKTYNDLGGSTSWLGFPITDGYPAPSGQRQDFEGGYILADSKTEKCQSFPSASTLTPTPSVDNTPPGPQIMPASPPSKSDDPMGGYVPAPSGATPMPESSSTPPPGMSSSVGPWSPGFSPKIPNEKPVARGSKTGSSGSRADGFISLFNGKDLTGWTGITEAFAVEGSKLVSLPGKLANLFTQQDYQDFILRFEFRLTPGANSGIGIHCPLESDISNYGIEVQILDDSDPQYKDLKPYMYNGSLWGIAPAIRGHLKPVGDWNSEEISANGRRVTVNLNGSQILDANLDDAMSAGLGDGKDRPGLKRTTGRIGILGHDSRVEFRNIQIKDLSSSPSESPNASEGTKPDVTIHADSNLQRASSIVTPESGAALPPVQPSTKSLAALSEDEYERFRQRLEDPKVRERMTPEQLAEAKRILDSHMQGSGSAQSGASEALPTAPGSQLPWKVDLKEAIAAATSENKDILAYFFLPQDEPCRKFEADVLLNAEVRSLLVSNFILLKVDLVKDNALASRLGVRTPKALVVLDRTGKTLQWLSGASAADLAAKVRLYSPRNAAQLPGTQTVSATPSIAKVEPTAATYDLAGIWRDNGGCEISMTKNARGYSGTYRKLSDLLVTCHFKPGEEGFRDFKAVPGKTNTFQGLVKWRFSDESNPAYPQWKKSVISLAGDTLTITECSYPEWTRIGPEGTN